MHTGRLERETGIEPASLAWKAKVLPLNYSRIARFAHERESNARKTSSKCSLSAGKPVRWWRRLDSNQRRRKPTDLQSAPFSHSGTPPERASDYATFLWHFTSLIDFFTNRSVFDPLTAEIDLPIKSGRTR